MEVVEETPPPGVGTNLRERMSAGAIQAAKAVGYRTAGTVECLVDLATQEYVFLEMNTRLRVEHSMTELVMGVDLIAEQFRVAAGELPARDLSAIEPVGHAVEMRVYAEDPRRFLPSPGLMILVWDEPVGEGAGRLGL
jgi:acetyl-CoA carboxylase biotin carboxylase subunit